MEWPKVSSEQGIAAGACRPPSTPRISPICIRRSIHHEALVESDRCYFCYDAPCMHACPTSIDIPLFIREITTGNPLGSAKTIFDQNILGGMCARVCPTETLCEEACVREAAEGKPVQIGRLQRYATDIAMAAGKQFYKRAAPTRQEGSPSSAPGRPASPAAHRLARHGHDVDDLRARPKPGGLNEYGIAAYKSVDNFAQAEVDYVTAIGGITIEHGKALGRDLHLADLVASYDAVFLGIGLAGVNASAGRGRGSPGRRERGRVHRRASPGRGSRRSCRSAAASWCIGGGMTAVDAAVQSKLLGAEEVTICYRRGKEHMNASRIRAGSRHGQGRHHQALAAAEARRRPGRQGRRHRARIYGHEDGKLAGTGETLTLAADQVFKAIGQTFEGSALNGSGARIAIENGRIKVDAEGRTSLPEVWAGGDCILGGDDLTVSAVAQGRDAAESIHRALTANGRA